MPSNFKEINELEKDQQVSDDFVLYSDPDEKLYYAVRHRSERGSLNFCLSDKTIDGVIAKAVDAIAFYITHYEE